MSIYLAAAFFFASLLAFELWVLGFPITTHSPLQTAILAQYIISFLLASTIKINNQDCSN